MVVPVLILGLLPGFVWLAFYLQEDRKKPEPKKLLVLSFLSGAAVTIPAVGLEILVRDGLRYSGVIDYGVISFLGLSLVEEVMKFSAAYFVIHKSREFDEPIDAMIYLVTAALGFATAENIAVNSGLLSAFDPSELAATSIIFGDVFDVTTRRFIGATLLHSLSSGIVGYYWALGIFKKKTLKFIIAGLLIATLLHAIFNYLIIKNVGIIFPTLFLALIAFFVLNDFEKLKNPWIQKSDNFSKN